VDSRCTGIQRTLIAVLEKVKGIEPCEIGRRRFYMDRATFQKIESKFYMNNTKLYGNYVKL